MVPALLYPALLVGSAELVMFKADSERDKAITYAVTGPIDKGVAQIDAILQKRKHFKKIESSQPEKDLADGKIDALIARKADYVELRVNQLLKVATLATTVNDNLNSAYMKELTEAFTAKGLAKENSQGFQIVSQNITASGNTQSVAGSQNSSSSNKGRLNKLENISATLCLLIFSLLMLGLGAAYPSIAVTAEEFERNTIETSCLLPVSRAMIMLGKVAAVSTFAAVSGLVNFASMYAVAALVLSQAKLFPRFSGDHLIFNLNLAQTLGLIACYLLLAVLISALMIFATSFCRTVRSAQQWTTFPLLIILLLPPCALFPNLELNS
ncbi:MAG: ABC transporter permease, partial [Candidatus Obscuribacterales bacterium]